MGVRFGWMSCRTKESAPHEPHRVGDRETSRKRCAGAEQPRQTRVGGPGRHLQHHLLREEAVQQRNAGHRCRSDGRQQCGDRHQPGKTADPVEPPRSGLVVNDAGAHEQRRLEQCVVEDVEHRHDHCLGCADAQQHDYEAEVTHRRIREKLLQIILEERNYCSH